MFPNQIAFIPVQTPAIVGLLLLKAMCIRWALEDGLATDGRKDNLQTMFVESDIEHMSVAERFQAMEVIWGSFLKSPEDVSSPSWHGEVLSKRLTKVEAGQGKFLTLEELKGRLGLSRS